MTTRNPILLLAALAGVAFDVQALAQQSTPKGDKQQLAEPRFPRLLVEETPCQAIRKWKHDESRVVFVLRCPDSEDIGLIDVDEELYKKGGVMPLQVDKE